jgi:hypothetical protein
VLVHGIPDIGSLDFYTCLVVEALAYLAMHIHVQIDADLALFRHACRTRRMNHTKDMDSHVRQELLQLSNDAKSSHCHLYLPIHNAQVYKKRMWQGL